MGIQAIRRWTFGVWRSMFDVQEKQMIDDLTADEVRELLKLEQHAVGHRPQPAGCRRGDNST